MLLLQYHKQLHFRPLPPLSLHLLRIKWMYMSNFTNMSGNFWCWYWCWYLFKVRLPRAYHSTLLCNISSKCGLINLVGQLTSQGLSQPFHWLHVWKWYISYKKSTIYHSLIFYLFCFKNLPVFTCFSFSAFSHFFISSIQRFHFHDDKKNSIQWKMRMKR